MLCVSLSRSEFFSIRRKENNSLDFEVMGFLAVTGAFALVYAAAKLAAFFYRLLCPVKVDITKFGQWALVTGCTDGIGRAYAIELAKRGRV